MKLRLVLTSTLLVFVLHTLAVSGLQCYQCGDWEECKEMRKNIHAGLKDDMYRVSCGKRDKYCMKRKVSHLDADWEKHDCQSRFPNSNPGPYPDCQTVNVKKDDGVLCFCDTDLCNISTVSGGSPELILAIMCFLWMCLY